MCAEADAGPGSGPDPGGPENPGRINFDLLERAIFYLLMLPDEAVERFEARLSQAARIHLPKHPETWPRQALYERIVELLAQWDRDAGNLQEPGVA